MPYLAFLCDLTDGPCGRAAVPFTLMGAVPLSAPGSGLSRDEAGILHPTLASIGKKLQT